MPAKFDWQEDNGAATGSPAKGTTRTTGITRMDWKDVDDPIPGLYAYPIIPGNNSYSKYNFAAISGTWTTISNVKWAHTYGLFNGINLIIKGRVTSTYTTPSTLTNSALTDDLSEVKDISHGKVVLLSTVGPECVSHTASVTNTGGQTVYTQYLATQLQTTDQAAEGETPAAIFTLRYDEV